MMNSTIKSKINNCLKAAFVIVFWCCIWHGLSLTVNNSFLLPGIKETFVALISILSDGGFYITVSLTILRVLSGLLLGSTAGIILAAACNKSLLISFLISPAISVIKSTPVASFIIVLWIMMSGDALAVFIAFLMVMPIIWQNLLDGYTTIDKNLLEVADIFEFSYYKKIKILVIPSLMKYFIPALITASGLAWKAEIAAEIIAYTKNSIGQQINDAKYFMDTPLVFAWTLIVIIFSIFLEFLTKRLLLRYK